MSSSFRSFYQSRGSLPTLEELQKRLNTWLRKRGKNYCLFRSLKLFEKCAIDEDNKENIEGDGHLDKGSYESLNIPQLIINGDNNSAHEKNEKINVDNIAKAALIDLQRLAQEVRKIEKIYLILIT